jgi:hypothetical protein
VSHGHSFLIHPVCKPINHDGEIVKDQAGLGTDRTRRPESAIQLEMCIEMLFVDARRAPESSEPIFCSRGRRPEVAKTLPRDRKDWYEAGG